MCVGFWWGLFFDGDGFFLGSMDFGVEVFPFGRGMDVVCIPRARRGFELLVRDEVGFVCCLKVKWSSGQLQ